MLMMQSLETKSELDVGLAKRLETGGRERWKKWGDGDAAGH
jgi:hypothetical protein